MQITELNKLARDGGHSILEKDNHTKLKKKMNARVSKQRQGNDQVELRGLLG